VARILGSRHPLHASRGDRRRDLHDDVLRLREERLRACRFGARRGVLVGGQQHTGKRGSGEGVTVRGILVFVRGDSLARQPFGDVDLAVGKGCERERRGAVGGGQLLAELASDVP
jgi:hypothetical protein